jgi:hypothetical protein
VAKKRKKTFQAGREARRVAREIVGIPPPQRVIQDKRTKPPKHKKSPREAIEL